METKAFTCIPILLFLLLDCGIIGCGAADDKIVLFEPNISSLPPGQMNVLSTSESIKPQITFSPANLSFTESDWQLENGKSIKISIYVPPHTRLNELRSKLSIPNGWNIVPNAEISSTTYVQSQDTIYAHDLNNLGENEAYITDQLWIKPTSNINPTKYYFVANSCINYSYLYSMDGELSKIENTSQTINLMLIKNEKPIDWLSIIGVFCAIITTFLAAYKFFLNR